MSGRLKEYKEVVEEKKNEVENYKKKNVGLFIKLNFKTKKCCNGHLI